MKKTLVLLLAAIMLLSLAACGGETVPPTTEDPFVSAVIGGEKIIFEPWLEAGIPTSGTYHLTQDVELTAPVTVSGELRLHLNGFRVTVGTGAAPGNMFVVPKGATMFLCEDEGDPGAVVSCRSYTAQPTVSSMFLVGGELTVLGGTVDASLIDLEDKANGLGIYVQSGGTANIAGGTIIGGTAWRAEKDPEDGVYYGDGGTIHVATGAVCNISGGTVQGGSAARGGNIFVADDPENPDNDGVVNMTGGTVVEGESLFDGGNVFVAGKFNMSDGLITKGGAYACGGNIEVSGDLRITGGSVTEGQCDINKKLHKRGGNIGVNGIYATVYIENAKILKGKASGKENYGGNISVYDYGASSFEIAGNTELTGGVGHRGGNFYIGHLKADIPAENMDYVISGTLFQDGTTTYRGANFCVDTKDKTKPIILTLNDCRLLELSDGSTTNIALGAGAYDVSQCHVTMNGGEIDGGQTSCYGSTSLTLNGVKLTGYNPAGTGLQIINE